MGAECSTHWFLGTEVKEQGTGVCLPRCWVFEGQEAEDSVLGIEGRVLNLDKVGIFSSVLGAGVYRGVRLFFILKH